MSVSSFSPSSRCFRCRYNNASNLGAARARALAVVLSSFTLMSCWSAKLSPSSFAKAAATSRAIPPSSRVLAMITYSAFCRNRHAQNNRLVKCVKSRPHSWRTFDKGKLNPLRSVEYMNCRLGLSHTIISLRRKRDGPLCMRCISSYL